jgi:hypothetical protein
LRAADLPVPLAWHERVEGDDAVAGDRGHRRPFGAVEGLVRPVGVDVAAAEHRRERRPFVVVAGAEDRRDPALTGEPADQLERIGVGLGRAVIGDVPGDHDGVQTGDLAAVVQDSAQRLARVDAVAVGAGGPGEVGVGQVQDPHPGNATESLHR